VITNDVSDYINLLVRIAHIICNRLIFPSPSFERKLHESDWLFDHTLFSDFCVYFVCFLCAQ